MDGLFHGSNPIKMDDLGAHPYFWFNIHIESLHVSISILDVSRASWERPLARSGWVKHSEDEE